MTTTNPERWSTLDLELFHDGELSDRERELLAADLRALPELRERLAGVVRIDAAARLALAQPAPAARPARFPTFALAVAASLALVAFAAWFVLRPVPAPRDIAQNHNLANNPGTPASASGLSGVRVVLSLPLRTPDRHAAPPERAVADALARGDVDGAERALTVASRSLRDDQLREIGELIRSAAGAEDLLDRLAPSEQLAACRVWADDPRLRPVAFARLERLRVREDLAGQYRDLLTGFADRPELRAWVRSYLNPDAKSS